MFIDVITVLISRFVIWAVWAIGLRWAGAGLLPVDIFTMSGLGLAFVQTLHLLYSVAQNSRRKKASCGIKRLQFGLPETVVKLYSSTL